MNNIDFSLIFAQLFNLLILFFLFKYFIAQHLHVLLEKRKQELIKLSLAEVQYQEKMNLAETQKQSLLTEAHHTTQVLLEESQILAQTKADILMEEAHERAESIIEGGRRTIEQERISMLATMKEHIVDVSLRLNEKMFGPAKNNKDFIKRELENMK